MLIDPDVEEVRRNGAKLAEECGYDIHRIAERLRQEQAAHPARLVSYPRRSREPHKPSPPVSP